MSATNPLPRSITHPVFLGLLIVGCAANLSPGEAGTATAADSLFAYQSGLWATPTIPVCWTDLNPAFATQRAWVRDAAERSWQAVSQVRFVGWGACPPPSTPAVRIRVADETPSSIVGRPGGVVDWTMTLNFQFGNFPCFHTQEQCVRWIAVHEFGHALGFVHEQNRPDNFGRCMNDAIDPPNPASNPITLGPFDSGSVMSFCAAEWNNGGRLSPGDIAGVRALYGDWDTGTASVLSPLFYGRAYPDVPSDPVAAADHWRSVGLQLGRRASVIFDPEVYFAVHGDLRDVFGGDGRAGIEHWRQFGHREVGRRGSLTYAASDYRAFNPDLAVFGDNAAALLDHYLHHGIAEGRRASVLFDPDTYFAFNQDLWVPLNRDPRAAAEHYELHGIHEGRRASPEFDPRFYLAANPDVAAVFGSTAYKQAALHWLAFGRREGREAAP